MLQKKIKVLVAEDDEQMGFIIKDSLEEEGFEVHLCADGETAWDEFQKINPDICLLDINMPGRDGLNVTRKIRQRNDVVPILFITAKSMDADKIKGFETGADDYITKPFQMKELIHRMQVFLRRNKMMKPEVLHQFTFGGLSFLPGENRLLMQGTEVLLTQKESDLLQFFCMHTNQVLRREDILNNVWGKNDYFLGRSMDVYIAKLRKLIKPEKQLNIETIHQAGYRMNVAEK